MSVENLLQGLNPKQRAAATIDDQHVLVLAGAGTGKTRTIVARAAYLISTGVPANTIQILAFTRRAANEIAERVKAHIGADASNLGASTFHTWCLSLMRRAPKLFGGEGHSVIDRDDQLQLFKLLRGKRERSAVPTAKDLCDIYSFARNTNRDLMDVISDRIAEYSADPHEIAEIMLAYEQKKAERKYLDYDDILANVAYALNNSPQARDFLHRHYQHLLVDEMQDTNPLQWEIIAPLVPNISLFCVGDDAQSIYGFRGADFRNVHSFNERVPGARSLKLLDNYRSFQEILDVSNWLMEQSPLTYNKRLEAVRGNGFMPQLCTLANEWEEANWIANKITSGRADGVDYRDNMVLVRSGFAGKTIESIFLAQEIPYVFIGGVKLMESAHVRDLLSIIRLVGNPSDEIAWIRYLTLWPGIGEVTASRLTAKLLGLGTVDAASQVLSAERGIPYDIGRVFRAVSSYGGAPAKALRAANVEMEELLAKRYATKDWEKRKRDFPLLEHLAEGHSTINGFIEHYILDPVNSTQVEETGSNDKVSLITIHSAKGAEAKVCFAINISPGAFPGPHSIGDPDDVEEERRVLYVALTRAQDQLYVTRRGHATWAEDNPETESYFLNGVPPDLFDDRNLITSPLSLGESQSSTKGTQLLKRGINIGSLPPKKGKAGPVVDSARLKEPAIHAQELTPNDESAEMPRSKLEVLYHRQSEQAAGVQIESCAASVDEDKRLHVVAELSTINGVYLEQAIKIQCLVYDVDNALMESSHDHWWEFGFLQSFSTTIYLDDFEEAPATIKIFVSKG